MIVPGGYGDTKPALGARIRAAHPLAPMAALLAMEGGGVPFTTFGDAGTFIGNAKWTGLQQFDLDGAGDAVQFSNAGQLARITDLTNNFSVVVRGTVRTVATTKGLVSVKDGNTDAGWIIAMDNTAAVSFPGISFSDSAEATATAGQLVTLVGIMRDGSARLYKNGLDGGSGAVATTVAAPTNKQLVVGRIYTNFVNFECDFVFEYALFYDWA